MTDGSLNFSRLADSKELVEEFQLEIYPSYIYFELLQGVIEACEKSFSKSSLSLEQSIFQIVAVHCLKAIITPEIGLRYFCDQDHAVIVNCLNSPSSIVTLQILEVMCGLCRYSYSEYLSYTNSSNDSSRPNEIKIQGRTKVLEALEEMEPRPVFKLILD